MALSRYTVLFFLVGLFAANVEARSEPIEIDRVVAVVNNEAITAYELQSRLASVEYQLKKQGTPLPPRDELQRQMLERMIMDRVQVQFAKEIGMNVSDAELDAAMRRIAESNRMSVAEFRAALEKDGIVWPKFREEIRQEITVARLRDREVNSKIVVTEGEIDNYLASPDAGGASAEYSLAHIIIRLPEFAGPDQLSKVRARAEQALQKIRQGEDFSKVAALYSDAPDALNGGTIGARTLDRLPTLYAEAVEKMQPGQVTEVLRSAAGFHIIKLLDKRGGTQALPAVRQTHARHILIKVNELVSDAEAKRKIEALKERLDNGGDFAELARLHSNDLSASSGGDLGWLNQGDTVPEFEKAMDALPINKVSAPVRSPFGWHLIQVLERRSSDGGPDRARLAARQALRERKSDEAYQDWLRQMRDRAYVEYHLDDR